MGLGTRDRTSNRTFSISVFHHRTNRPIPRSTKNLFFRGRRKDIFFSTKRPFFSTKRPFSLRQVRKRHFFCGRTGSISVGVRFGVSDRTTGWPVRFGEATEPRYRNATETHTYSVSITETNGTLCVRLRTKKRRRTSSKHCAPHILQASAPHFHLPVH